MDESITFQDKNRCLQQPQNGYWLVGRSGKRKIWGSRTSAPGLVRKQYEKKSPEKASLSRLYGFASRGAGQKLAPNAVLWPNRSLSTIDVFLSNGPVRGVIFEVHTRSCSLAMLSRDDARSGVQQSFDGVGYLDARMPARARATVVSTDGGLRQSVMAIESVLYLMGDLTRLPLAENVRRRMV
jgi:hypothetical protein